MIEYDRARFGVLFLSTLLIFQADVKATPPPDDQEHRGCSRSNKNWNVKSGIRVVSAYVRAEAKTARHFQR